MWVFCFLDLLKHHQLHVEDEGGAAGDGALTNQSSVFRSRDLSIDQSEASIYLTPGTVAQVTRDGQLGPLTHRHLGDALLPALNNLLLA